MGEWFSVVVFRDRKPLAHRRARKVRFRDWPATNPNKVAKTRIEERCFEHAHALRIASQINFEAGNAAERPEPDWQLQMQK